MFDQQIRRSIFSNAGYKQSRRRDARRSFFLLSPPEIVRLFIMSSLPLVRFRRRRRRRCHEISQ